MRTLPLTFLPRVIKQFPFLVFGRFVFSSAVLTQRRVGVLKKRGDGQFLWIVTEGGQRTPWEFQDTATALEIQRNEEYVSYVTALLSERGIAADIRQEVRDRIVSILVWHADDLVAPRLAPKLCTDYPVDPALF